jgi:hypothetical protein
MDAFPSHVRARSTIVLYLCFTVVIALNVGFWLHARKILPQWDNVPPVPTASSASISMLGDRGAAYRMMGYTLQNLGNTGGRYTSLKEYDYDALERWFFTTHELDPRSDFVPFLASYYFGALDDEPEKMSHVTDFLVEAGMAPYPQKWRWLAQAVYMARFKEKNLDKALTLANKLAAMPGDMPPWARQMPAFVNMAMGNKQASYELMVRMLKSGADELDPNEIRAMLDYICDQTLTPDEASKNALCQNRK